MNCPGLGKRRRFVLTSVFTSVFGLAGFDSRAQSAGAASVRQALYGGAAVRTVPLGSFRLPF